MSGITTTGSTIIADLENTPKGILFWRAILQWLGGIGIIVMAITLMPIMNVEVCNYLEFLVMTLQKNIA